MIPPTGKVHSPLGGIRSGQHPQLGFTDRVRVVGSLTINLGTFGVFGRSNSSPKKTINVSLAQAPVTGAGNVQSVNVIAGSKDNEYIIQCRDSANAISTAAALVNVQVQIGPAVGV